MALENKVKEGLPELGGLSSFIMTASQIVGAVAAGYYSYNAFSSYSTLVGAAAAGVGAVLGAIATGIVVGIPLYFGAMLFSKGSKQYKQTHAPTPPHPG